MFLGVGGGTMTCRSMCSLTILPNLGGNQHWPGTCTAQRSPEDALNPQGAISLLRISPLLIAGPTEFRGWIAAFNSASTTAAVPWSHRTEWACSILPVAVTGESTSKNIPLATSGLLRWLGQGFPDRRVTSVGRPAFPLKGTMLSKRSHSCWPQPYWLHTVHLSISSYLVAAGWTLPGGHISTLYQPCCLWFWAHLGTESGALFFTSQSSASWLPTRGYSSSTCPTLI